MKSDYFVEFVYHGEALRNQNQYKFLVQKYKRNKEIIEGLKLNKVKEINSFIAVLDLLETDLKEFKKLVPTPPGVAPTVKTEVAKPVKKVAKKKAKKKVVQKQAQKKKGNLKDLKLGLEKIRDELSRM